MSDNTTKEAAAQMVDEVVKRSCGGLIAEIENAVKWVKIIDPLLLKLFDGDKQKSWVWLHEPNASLGGLSPMAMIDMGDGEALLRFVENSLPTPSDKLDKPK